MHTEELGMSYKKVDKIFENWRDSYGLQPIYHTGIEILNEAVSRRDFIKGLGALGVVGGATLASLDGDDPPENIEPEDTRTELQKYQDEVKKKGDYSWRTREVEVANSPALADGVEKEGWLKGTYNPKSPMKRMIKKYKDSWYQLNARMVYVHPGALEPDEVLPTTGLTVDQQKDWYYTKDIVNLHNNLYSPHAWPYNAPFDNALYLYNEKGQIYLPLAWSVALDVWQQKIYEFLDDVAENAYVERDGRYVQESEAAVKKVIRRYHMGSKEERIYILKEFELSQGDDFKISEYLEETARRIHSAKPDTGIQESIKRRKIWIKRYN